MFFSLRLDSRSKAKQNAELKANEEHYAQKNASSRCNHSPKQVPLYYLNAAQFKNDTAVLQKSSGHCWYVHPSARMSAILKRIAA